MFAWLRRLFGGRPARPAKPTTAQREAAFDRVTLTWEVPQPQSRSVHIVYAPRRDSLPDAGEVVWAWVPFQENPAEGKDRPLLVIARHDVQRVYALKLTSRPPQGRRDHVSIGGGPWDRQGRESWVDLDQLYSVHHGGVRRVGAALDRRTFATVGRALSARHGWRFDG